MGRRQLDGVGRVRQIAYTLVSTLIVVFVAESLASITSQGTDSILLIAIVCLVLNIWYEQGEGKSDE